MHTMTAKEELRERIEELTEEEANEALRLSTCARTLWSPRSVTLR